MTPQTDDVTKLMTSQFDSFFTLEDLSNEMDSRFSSKKLRTLVRVSNRRSICYQ